MIPDITINTRLPPPQRPGQTHLKRYQKVSCVPHPASRYDDASGVICLDPLGPLFVLRAGDVQPDPLEHIGPAEAATFTASKSSPPRP